MTPSKLCGYVGFEHGSLCFEGNVLSTAPVGLSDWVKC